MLSQKQSGFFRNAFGFLLFGIGLCLILWSGAGWLEFMPQAKNQSLDKLEYLGFLIETSFYYSLAGVIAFLVIALVVLLLFSLRASWRKIFTQWSDPLAVGLVLAQELFYTRLGENLLAPDLTLSQIIRANVFWALYSFMFFIMFLVLVWAIKKRWQARRLSQMFWIMKWLYFTGVVVFFLIVLSYPVFRPWRWLLKPYQADTVSAQIERTNVLIITIDALRPDHLSAYGYSGIKTSAIDSLAEEGVLFEKAYSASNWTFASLMSFVSSHYPDAVYACEPVLTGIEPDYSARVKDPLNPEYVEKIMAELDTQSITIAEVLKAYDYKTGAIFSNWFGALFLYVAQGFDTFSAPAKLISWLSPTRRLILYHINPPTLFLVAGKIYGAYLHQQFEFDPHSATYLNQQAKKFLTKNPNKKFLLWLHYLEPHSPYGDPWLPPPEPLPGYHGFLKPGFSDSYLVASGELSLTEEDVQYLKYLYDYDLSALDKELGNLFDFLKKHHLWDNTIIILTADHGEQFLEHGLLGHGFNFYEEEIRVPLIIKPAGDYSPRRVSDPVSLVDLGPTILDLLEIKPPNDFLGNSFKNLMLGKPETKERIVYTACSGIGPKSSAMVQGDYKLIYRIMPDSGAEKIELYNNLLDPLNQNNLASSLPELSEQMTARIKSLIQQNRNLSAKSSSSKRNLKLRPEDMDELRALGYVK